jgi:hypothetical protein
MTVSGSRLDDGSHRKFWTRHVHTHVQVMSLGTVEEKTAYLTKALKFAAQYDGVLSKYKAMIRKYPEEELVKCASIATIKRRVRTNSTDGTLPSMGGSRMGSGRKKLPQLVSGERRKVTMDRARMQVLRKDEKESETNWRDVTFRGCLRELGDKESVIKSIRVLADAAVVCFDYTLQDASPLYEHGEDTSFILDLEEVNPVHGTRTTGQQRRIILPSDRQKHKENLKGTCSHALVITFHKIHNTYFHPQSLCDTHTHPTI